jgi:hypothetical protein
MDKKYYSLAQFVTNAMKCIAMGDDISAYNQGSLCKDILRNLPDNAFYTKLATNLVFSEFFTIMSMDSRDNRECQTKCVKLLQDVYGEDHLVLSDLCKAYIISPKVVFCLISQL